MRKNRSLRIKLFSFVFLFVMVCILVLLGIYSYVASNQRLEQNSHLFEERLEGMVTQVDNIVYDMDAISAQVLASQILQEMFVEASSKEYEGVNYFEYNIDERKRAQDILWSLNSPKKRTDSINVFSTSSYVGLRYSPATDVIKEIAKDSKWQVPESEKYLLLGPHTDEWEQGQQKEVISLVRNYVATAFGFRTVGTIEVQQNYQIIEKIFDLPEDEKMSVTVVDSEGNTIYSNGIHSVEDIESGWKDNVLRESEHEDNTYMEMKATAGSADWTIILSQPKSVFYSSTYELLNVLVLTGCISGLIISLGLMMLIGNITKPVLELANDFQQITELEQKLVLHNTNVKEVQILQESFLKLLMHLKQSQDELILANETELNLRILGLQSQINPHFLFNSLNAISATAIEEHSEKVPTMCYQLGELFRYSSGGHTSVTLNDEINYMKTYLQFMKYRYEDNFSFEIEQQGDGNSIEIARMTLQPLVENCFTHAFKTVIPPYKMKVVCSVNEDGWKFEVSDNGGGFSQEQIKVISEEIFKIDSILHEKKGYENLKSKDMAILNIYIRLKLQYAEQMYIEIVRDEELQGAKVKIVVDYNRCRR